MTLPSVDDDKLTESTFLVKNKDVVETTHAKYGADWTGKHLENDEKIDPNNQQPNVDKDNSPEKVEAIESEPNTCHLFDKIKAFLSSVPRRKVIVLILCAFANFISNSAFAIIAPFFPSVALRKGIDLTAIGFVFSLYQLGGIIASPIIGNYMNRVGAKFVYTSGLFVTGISVICFGVLDRGPDGTIFLVMCILCRVVESVGAAAFTTASFTIVSTEFPNHVGTVVAVINSGSSLGLMIGPLIGGVLYQAGGYGLPFFVIAGLSLLDAVFIYFYLPTIQTVEQKREKSILSLIRNVRIFVPFLCVVVGIAGIGIYDATFATLVGPFKLSAPVIGALYVPASGLHTLMSPFWGFLSDSIKLKEILLIVALFIFGLGFLISGPSPLLPFIPFELWAVCLGFGLLGLSLGGMTITSLSCMTKGAHELGYDKNLDTSGLVSGLYYSGYSMGGFAGPLIGSVIVQHYGFPTGYTIFGMVSFFVMFIVLVYLFIRLSSSWRKKCKEENY